MHIFISGFFSLLCQTVLATIIDPNCDSVWYMGRPVPTDVCQHDFLFTETDEEQSHIFRCNGTQVDQVMFWSSSDCSAQNPNETEIWYDFCSMFGDGTGQMGKCQSFCSSGKQCEYAEVYDYRKLAFYTPDCTNETVDALGEPWHLPKILDYCEVDSRMDLSQKYVCDNEGRVVENTYSDSECGTLVKIHVYPNECSNGKTRTCTPNPNYIAPTIQAPTPDDEDIYDPGCDAVQLYPGKTIPANVCFPYSNGFRLETGRSMIYRCDQWGYVDVFEFATDNCTGQEVSKSNTYCYGDGHHCEAFCDSGLQCDVARETDNCTDYDGIILDHCVFDSQTGMSSEYLCDNYGDVVEVSYSDSVCSDIVGVEVLSGCGDIHSLTCEANPNYTDPTYPPSITPSGNPTFVPTSTAPTLSTLSQHYQTLMPTAIPTVGPVDINNEESETQKHLTKDYVIFGLSSLCAVLMICLLSKWIYSRCGKQNKEETNQGVTHQQGDSATISSQPSTTMHQEEGNSPMERNLRIGIDERTIQKETNKEEPQLAAVISVDNYLDKMASVELYGKSTTATDDGVTEGKV